MIVRIDCLFPLIPPTLLKQSSDVQNRVSIISRQPSRCFIWSEILPLQRLSSKFTDAADDRK